MLCLLSTWYPHTVPNDQSPDDRKERFLLLEYAQAQESAQYHDSLTWEVTSIIWGASTLLIGFIVEALCNGNPAVQAVIAGTAVLGILLTWISFYLMLRNNRRMNELYLVCQKIECELSLPNSIHCEAKKQVHERKWRGQQKRLYLIVSTFFSIVWILILVSSIVCLQRGCHHTDQGLASAAACRTPHTR